MIDMRKRFRGNQPIAVSKEIEGEKGEQLYGGGQAVGEARVGNGREGAVELVEGVDGEWRERR